MGWLEAWLKARSTLTWLEMVMKIVNQRAIGVFYGLMAWKSVSEDLKSGLLLLL